MHTISIITATLNRPSLKDACESVNNQTFKDWHHYVIGDGILPTDYLHPNRTTIGFSRAIGAEEPGANMPDGTPNPLLRWALIHLELGIFVSFLDDDNEYRPEFLEIMHNALRTHPDDGIAICALENHRYELDWDGYPEQGRCDNSGFIVYSRIAKEIGFPKASLDRNVVQDVEFIIECSRRYGWTHVPERLVRFGVSPNTPPLRGRTKILYSWSLPMKGVQLAKSGRYEEAISVFNKALEIDSKDAWTLWHLGEVLYYIGRTKEGMDAWNQWLCLMKNQESLPHDWIQYCYAVVSLVKGDIQNAVSKLTEAIECARKRFAVEPENKDNIINLCLYLLLIGEIPSAFLLFTDTIKKQLYRDDIEEIIWSLRVLQSTGLNIPGAAEFLELLQKKTNKAVSIN